MEQNSENLSIFVPWFSKKPRHRGELLSFDPSENLQNSKYAGEKFESCSSCSSIYTACSVMESAHVYTCRCELFFHSYAYRYCRTFRLRMSEGSHSLCLMYYNNK